MATNGLLPTNGAAWEQYFNQRFNHIVNVRPVTNQIHNKRHYEEAPLSVMKAGRGHPLYFNFKTGSKNDPHYHNYRATVRSWLEAHKSHSNTLNCVLEYVNFLEHEARNVIITETQIVLKTQLIHVPIMTVINGGAKDIMDTCFYIYLPTNIPLEQLAETVVFLLRRHVSKGRVDNSFNNVKSSARLSVFIAPQDTTRPIKSELMNNNTNTLREILTKWNMQPEMGVFHVLLKKEKVIERIVAFPQGFTTTVRQLAKLATSENWDNSLWILNNLVDQVFSQQYQNDHIVHSKSNHLYYLNTTLVTPMGDIILMELESQNTEVKFCFRRWIHNHVNARLPDDIYNAVLPPPDWGILPSFNPNLDMCTHVTHIFSDNRKRIVDAVVKVDPNLGVDYSKIEVWLKQEMDCQIKKARNNPMLVAPHWYNTKNIVGLLLPLYMNGRLILVAAIEPSGRMYNVVTLLLPAWARNNARILGPIKHEWLNAPFLEA